MLLTLSQEKGFAQSITVQTKRQKGWSDGMGKGHKLFLNDGFVRISGPEEWSTDNLGGLGKRKTL